MYDFVFKLDLTEVDKFWPLFEMLDYSAFCNVVNYFLSISWNEFQILILLTIISAV